MMPSPMEKDYWRTRTIAEAKDQGYSHLRLTCACGRITDYPFTLLLQRQGVSRESFRPFGSPVFARAGKTDPPSRLILSQTSAGTRCLAYVIGSSSSRAVPLFVPCGRSCVPARACAETPPAGVVKAGRRAYLASRSGAARPRLDGPEHGATLTPVGTPSCPCCCIRSCAPC